MVQRDSGGKRQHRHDYATHLSETILAGKGPQAVGGVTRGTEEWVFEGPVQIAALLNAETNDDATHKLGVDYYEVKE